MGLIVGIMFYEFCHVCEICYVHEITCIMLELICFMFESYHVYRISHVREIF